MYSNIVFINLNCGGSHIDSPNCIKKSIINPVKENDSKEFQYPTTVGFLHYIMKEWEEIRKEFRKFRLLSVNIAGKE